MKTKGGTDENPKDGSLITTTGVSKAPISIPLRPITDPTLTQRPEIKRVILNGKDGKIGLTKVTVAIDLRKVTTMKGDKGAKHVINKVKRKEDIEGEIPRVHPPLTHPKMTTHTTHVQVVAIMTLKVTPTKAEIAVIMTTILVAVIYAI